MSVPPIDEYGILKAYVVYEVFGLLLVVYGNESAYN
jgi:hypothetical protein